PLRESGAPGASDSAGRFQRSGPRAALVFQHQHACGPCPGPTMGRPMTQVLVIHPGAFGDTLLALPVLTGLKMSYAPASLELIGHPVLVELLPGRSVVDRMTSID